MQNIQTRPISVVKLLGVVLMGVALIAAIALLTTRNAIELPIVGSGGTTSTVGDDDVRVPSTSRQRADRPASGFTHPSAPVVSDQALTKAGHRYQAMAAEGFEFDRDPTYYADEFSIATEHFNHRFFTDEQAEGRGSASHPEHHPTMTPAHRPLDRGIERS